MTRTLVLMVKEPRAGRVKTRLGRDIGMTRAAWWFRHQAQRTIRRLRDPRWHLVLAVTPDAAGLTSRVWPGDLRRIGQGRGDLGSRMARMLATPVNGPVCVIGGDIPGITRADIASSFSALGRHDAVFGPATDGGYWLIGLARRRVVPRGFLTRVRWSGPHALSDSIATLPRDWRVARIATLADVDTAADLRRFCR